MVACVRADAGGDLVGPLDEELRWVAEALQRRMGFRLRTGPGPAHSMVKLTVQAPRVKSKQALWVFWMLDSFLYTGAAALPVFLSITNWSRKVIN